MFASEHILWNDSFCALELSKSNKIKWSQRDFILTDKACYVFNDTPNGETADYLESDKCERLDMNDFRAAKPASVGGLPPIYFSELPP